MISLRVAIDLIFLWANVLKTYRTAEYSSMNVIYLAFWFLSTKSAHHSTCMFFLIFKLFNLVKYNSRSKIKQKKKKKKREGKKWKKRGEDRWVVLTSAHGVLIKNGNSHDNENFDRAWCTTAAAAAAATPLAVPSPPAVHPTALFLRFVQLFRRYVKKGVMIKKK